MIIEVSILDEQTHFEVQVFNMEEEEREEDLERTFATVEEANGYIDTLVQDKRYIVHHSSK